MSEEQYVGWGGRGRKPKSSREMALQSDIEESVSMTPDSISTFMLLDEDSGKLPTWNVASQDLTEQYFNFSFLPKDLDARWLRFIA